MHCLLSVYCDLQLLHVSGTYLLIIKRHCIYNYWYVLCVLCRLAASRVGVPLQPCYTVPLDDEQISARNMWRLLILTNRKHTVHLVGSIMLIYILNATFSRNIMIS
jgi:hypothetical protein